MSVLKLRETKGLIDSQSRDACVGKVRAHTAADARCDELTRGVWAPADRYQLDACRALSAQSAAVLHHQGAARDDFLREHAISVLSAYITVGGGSGLVAY